MSRAYREHLERLYPALSMFRDEDYGQERQQADQGLEQQYDDWLADQAAQEQFVFWLDTLTTR
jgi:hypothetical protein